jgi:energy-coupling factor transporter ATP-binding protein EcfA2
MKTLQLEIKGIKGIHNANLEIPLENGIYALVGCNGCGKSTILQSLAQLIRPTNALWALKTNDFSPDSCVNFHIGNEDDNWYATNNHRWKNSIYSSNRQSGFNNNIAINGMYEGSLFVGTRFQDSTRVDDLITNGTLGELDFVDADTYVKNNMSFILWGDYKHYLTLKRLKNRQLREQHNLKNLPYFIKSSYGGIISQYRMSSGECLLLSLLHFIHNAIIRSSLPKDIPILMLLDEIELALHPVAVSRFLDLLEDIVGQYKNVVVILTTHAPEVIRRINPNSMYKLENDNGIVDAINPCYPSYAIRELYVHDKYDFLILCEDKLARDLIKKIILRNKIGTSKLYYILPVGGWENVLKLHKELLIANVVGIGTKIISVLDGDIKSQCEKCHDYDTLLKLFLPIPSIEKFLYQTLINTNDKNFKKTINDKYFQLKSVDGLISDFNRDHLSIPKHPDKIFYRYIRKDLEERKISEDNFISSLCDDIVSVSLVASDVNKFESQLLIQMR